jgi:hypothetical protein
MKRIFALITTLFILFCGCAQTAEQPAETAAPPAEPQTSELTLLSDRNFSYIDDNGFYSLEDMGNGDFQNLMYSDFAQMKQSYLCDVEVCGISQGTLYKAKNERKNEKENENYGTEN